MNLFNLIKNANIKILKFFYDSYFNKTNIIDRDELEFNEKINKIYNLIANENISDIDSIAKDNGCNTFEECVIKIRYLENKRIIENVYIDLSDRKVKKCSLEDEKLLEKYFK